MKAKIRGTEIYFDVAGMQVEARGNKLIEKPVLFMIHGGPGGNHLHYKMDSIQLQDVAQLVFIDQRGCGWSKKAKKSTYNLENNIKDIEALRKYLGLERICLIGFSYGGMVAQGYAIKYPQNVEKLILASTAPSYHFIADAKANLQKLGNAKQIEICDKYLWNGSFDNEKTMAQYFKTMESLYYYGKKRRKRIQSSGKHAQALKNIFSHEVLNAGFGDFLHHFNFIPQLKKITSPTLILAGKNDWICSYKQAQIMAKHIKHAKLKVFTKCSHILAMDQNKRYLKEVKKFLKRK